VRITSIQFELLTAAQTTTILEIDTKINCNRGGTWNLFSGQTKASVQVQVAAKPERNAIEQNIKTAAK
jgi:hypothetical protein